MESKTIIQMNIYKTEIKLISPQPDSPRKKRERIQTNRIRNEKGEVTTETTEIQRRIRDCYKQLHTKKNRQPRKMGKFERYNLPRLTQEEIGSMNRPISSIEIETLTKNLPTNKNPGQMTSQTNIQRRVNTYTSETVSKIAEEGILPTPP